MVSATPWSNLPDVLLIKIYLVSYDSDRLNMACVCKNWNRLFSSPVLWRHRRVVFKGLLSERTAQVECKFLRKYGQYLEKLTLCFGSPTFRTCKIVSMATEKYLGMLASRKDIQIRTLDLEHLHMEQNWHFILSRKRLVLSICKVLRKQRFLETVFCSGARLTLLDGCRFLECLGRGCRGKTLTTLYMEDLFESNILPYRTGRYIEAMSNFRSLKQLHINYKYLNTDVLKTFGKKLNTSLVDLSMIFEGDSRGLEIPEESWREFAKSCPLTKAGAYLCTTIFRGPLSNPFKAGMPLTECYVTSWTRINDNEERLSSFLRHLGNTYSKSLRAIALSFERHEPFDEALVYVLSRCRNLTDICVSARLNADTLIQICHLHSKGKMNLKCVSFAVSGICDDDWQRIDFYVSSLMANIYPNVDIGPTDRGSSATSTITVSTQSLEEEEEEEVPDEIILLPDDGEGFLPL